MRILIINWQDIKHPLAGGAEVHLHEIFERIVDMGHQVTLFSCGFPNAKKEENINGIRVIRAGARSYFNFILPFYYFGKLRKEKYDIVVLDINKIPFFTPFFIRHPRAGIVHHFFGKAIFLEASFPINYYVYFAEKLFLKIYRKLPILYYSPSTRDEMIKDGFPEENFHYVPIAVNLEHYRVLDDVPKEKTPLIAYLGRIKRYKSIDHILSAMPKVIEKVPDVKLAIIGDGDDRPRLEEMSKNLGISDRVIFTGFVSEDEKVRWLNRAWIVLSPSSKEGWGLTMTEANACGTPVIAANSPGLRDAVKDGETGILYPYGDIESLGDNIIKLLTDDNLRNKLRDGGLKSAKRYTWDDAAKITLNVLEKIVKKSNEEKK